MTSYSNWGAQEPVTEVVDDFTVTYLNPCLDPNYTTITATPQTDFVSDDFSSTDITYTYNPYTVVPSFCPLTVTCVSVTGPTNYITCPVNPLDDPNVPDDGSLTNNFNGDDYVNGLQPGDYVY